MIMIVALPTQFCEAWFTTEPQLQNWGGSPSWFDVASSDEPASSD